MAPLIRQVGVFLGVGVMATAVHYTILIGLVQFAGRSAVPSALLGFCVGGVVSYSLNRRLTFSSDRPHHEAIWRFALVALVAFLLTYLSMRQQVDVWHENYLVAQLVTTGFVTIWTFLANRAWTFRAA